RAGRVRDYLISSGVPEDRVGPVVFHGSEAPLVNVPGQENEMNRSVELVIDWVLDLVDPSFLAGETMNWNLNLSVTFGVGFGIGGQMQIGAPCFALPDGERVGGGGGEAFLDGGDRGAQTHQVAVLGIAGQPVLVIVGGDDRVGPPGARLGGQRGLAGVEPHPARLAPGVGVQIRRWRLGPTHRRQVGAPQPAHVLGNQVQYAFVVRAGPQSGVNRHTRGRRDRLDAAPLPQPCRPHPRTIPPTTDIPAHDQHRPTNQPTTTNPGASPRLGSRA
ncbi:MAG: putative outer membrane protein, partial [Mycobacterium sp.]|nr:putative outer membrane protein [Mycobacterium sp.]